MGQHSYKTGASWVIYILTVLTQAALSILTKLGWEVSIFMFSVWSGWYNTDDHLPITAFASHVVPRAVQVHGTGKADSQKGKKWPMREEAREEGGGRAYFHPLHGSCHWSGSRKDWKTGLQARRCGTGTWDWVAWKRPRIQEYSTQFECQPEGSSIGEILTARWTEWPIINKLFCYFGGFPGCSVVKNPPVKVGDAGSDH